MKKIVISTIFIVGLCLPVSAKAPPIVGIFQNNQANPGIAQNNQETDPPGLVRPPEFYKPIVPEPPSPTTQTEYLYPDNSAKPESRLIKKERAIGKLREGLNLKNARLVTYSDYMKFKSQLGGDSVENAQVHPNRRVWLIEIEAPNGINVPQKVRDQKTPRLEKFKKSKILMVVDAETGDRLSVDIAENQ